MKKLYLTLLTIFYAAIVSKAQTDSTITDNFDEGSILFDLSLEEILDIDVGNDKFQLYGFLNSNLEKVYANPSVDENGNTVKEDSPMEWSPVKNFHIYASSNLSDKISVFFNLAAEDDFLTVRNAYGNFKIKRALQFRVGKMYRRFGLYNEKLDQIPTFLGIEPPEMLDSDHLFLTRTTSFMVHGDFDAGQNKILYALTSGNGEGGPHKKQLPLGWDLRYKSNIKGLTFGTSGYSSSITNGISTSTVGLGEGSPKGGVLPWMSEDNFLVAGLFAEKKLGDLLIQTAFYNAHHKAKRDPNSILTIYNNTSLNSHQTENFFGDANISNPGVDDVIIDSDYNVQTWYVRLGYNIDSKVGQFVPYLFWDWMSHPEVIQDKTWGGDNEAGLADDGKFSKPSIGVVYRPIPVVAIKLDGSMHIQEFNGQTETYPEIRLDFSFAFDAFKSIGAASNQFSGL